MLNSTAEHPERQSEAVPEPVETYLPPRFWWLKRVSIGVLAVFLLLVAIHQAALYRNKRALNRLIEAARAKGEPVYAEDFNRASAIPDDENAAILYQKAATAFTWPAELDAMSSLNNFIKPEFLAQHLSESKIILKANAEILDMLHRARSRENVGWNARWASLPFQSRFADLGGYRTAIRLLITAAQTYALEGEHSKAIETLADGVCFVERLESVGSIFGYWTSIAMMTVQVRAIETITPSLHMDAFEIEKSVDARSVSPDQMRSFVLMLLDERGDTKGWKEGIFSERAYQLVQMEALSSGTRGLRDLFQGSGAGATAWDRLLWFFAAPHWYADARRCFRYQDLLVQAGMLENYAMARKAAPSITWGDSLVDMYVTPFTTFLLVNLDRSLLYRFKIIAFRRMAATALAIRWYEVENGHRPAELAELVPKYLPAVPVDPFAADGRKIGYLPDHDPPLLYSVNADGIDEQGAFGVYRRGSVDDSVKDLVFFLNADQPH